MTKELKSIESVAFTPMEQQSLSMLKNAGWEPLPPEFSQDRATKFAANIRTDFVQNVRNLFTRLHDKGVINRNAAAVAGDGVVYLDENELKNLGISVTLEPVLPGR